jgi:hypothetical protein
MGLRPRVSVSRSPGRDCRCCLPVCTNLGQDPRVTKFRGSIPFTAGQPVQSIHPRYLSVYASTRLLPDALQHSIPGLWLAVTRAGFPPACQQTISSPHVHRFVRGLRSSAAGAALDDRRPVGGASSYRAAAAVASIFFRVQRPGIRSGPAIAVTTRFRARSCTFFPIPGFRSRKIRSKPSDAPDGLIFQRKFSIGSGRFPSNRERPARRTSPAILLRSSVAHRRRPAVPCGRRLPCGRLPRVHRIVISDRSGSGMAGSGRCAHRSGRPRTTVILPDAGWQASRKFGFREAGLDTAAVAGDATAGGRCPAGRSDARMGRKMDGRKMHRSFGRRRKFGPCDRPPSFC